MRRMTRSTFKQESIEDDPFQHPSLEATGPPAATFSTMIHEEHVASSGSGDTIADDGNVQMSGANGHTNVNGVTNGEDTPFLPENDAMANLAQHSRQLIQAIQNLETLNIDATLPSLPRVAVVGDQSAGKSSIIEGVCNITVPRDQGTCTRCPFQITTSSPATTLGAGGSVWVCRIQLHRKYAYDIHARAKRDPNAYDCWLEQDELNVYDFATVHDERYLEDALRRAQLAILNPHHDPAEFLKDSLSYLAPKVAFSPNVVSLRIESLGLPELSFFDLPGAINVTEDAADNHLVDFVERLIKHYLRDEKTLVLLACSADQDVENSTTFKFVRQCNALKRCMGVLTKPDLIARNRFPALRRVLNGEVFPLANKWYVAKQLSQEDLDAGCTHADARMREKLFFDTELWASLGLSERLGTPALQTALSEQFTDHILRGLPEITSRVKGRLARVATQLQEFPEKPVSASHTVMDETRAVIDVIVKHLRGDGMENDFRMGFRGLLRGLGKQLSQLRPLLVLSTPGYDKHTIELNDSSDEQPEATPARRLPADVSTPTKVRKGNNGQGIRMPQLFTRSSAASTPRSARVKREGSVQVETVTPARERFKLDKVHEMFERGTNSGLPGLSNPKVTDLLILLSTTGWKDVVAAALEDLKQLLKNMLERSIDDSLALRLQTQLYLETKSSVRTLFTTLMDAQNHSILHIVACEMHKPFTHNSKELARSKEAIRKELTEERTRERVDEYCDANPVPNKRHPSFEDRKSYAQSKLGGDEYGREIGAMTTVLAYYDIASASMLDTITKHLEFDLMFALETQLHGTLRTALKVTNEEHCVQLLAESPEREALRARLLAEKDRLNVALAELKALPQVHGGDF